MIKIIKLGLRNLDNERFQDSIILCETIMQSKRILLGFSHCQLSKIEIR